MHGVYCRSRALGNMLVRPDTTFGLIVLADMRILPSLRQRNLQHMQRYTQDYT